MQRNKILFFLFIFQCVYAKPLVVDYRVEFGIVGEVAHVHSLFTKSKDHYQIDVYLKTVGILARLATHNLEEHHISKGSIDKQGMYISQSFEMIKTYGTYRSRTLYRPNHQSKQLKRTYKKWLLKKDKTERKIQDYTRKLHYYATNDMLTLFLNLNHLIPNKIKPTHYTFKAIGEDRKDGSVDIHIPDKKTKKEMLSLLGTPLLGEWFATVVMHRQLYNSKEGEILVRMGKDSLIKKAVLKDILLYGDVRIIRE